MLRLDPKQTVIDRLSQGPLEDGEAVLSAEAEAIAARPVERGYSGAVISGVAQIVEAAMLVALGLGIYAFYVADAFGMIYGPIVLGCVLVANIFFNATQSHRISAYRTYFRQSLSVLGGWALVFVILTLGMFLFKAGDMISRVWLVGWFVSGAVALIVYRQALRMLVMRWTEDGRLKRRTVIVGGGEDAATLIEAIHKSAASDVELVGLFDDRDDSRSPPQVLGYRKLGRVHDLIAFSRRAKIDLVIVAMPLSAEKRVLDMLRQLWVLPVDIRLSAHMSQLRFTEKAYSYLGDVPVFDMADRPISDWNLVFKWVFDKLVAVSALIVLSPVMIATAIAIKTTSRGPVLFRQKRYGFNNELIEIYKFRSMYVDASDAAAARLVTRDDPRVTPVGRFIRKTSIDELPQLFNVLKGQLSIVGPRPHALQAKAANKLYHEAVDGYFARHKVKPGITGWAQIHGWRGETDTLDKIMKRVDHDLYYIENWSLFLDLYILVVTPMSLLSKRENAF